LNKTNVFASKPPLLHKELLYTKTVIHKHHVLHTNNVLAGPVQELFAAYRIALSMVAGGTRRRRLNMKKKKTQNGSGWHGIILFREEVTVATAIPSHPSQISASHPDPFRPMWSKDGTEKGAIQDKRTRTCADLVWGALRSTCNSPT
jgi:hypothetical protein